MLIRNFLTNRKSIREYKNKEVNQDILNELIDYGNVLESGVNIRHFKFSLYRNGKSIYEALIGKGGYAGVMIKSPHYISLDILNDSTKSIVKASYAMESLITKATELGLGTCWISIENVDEKTKKEILDNGSQVNYLLAVGYPAVKNPFKEDVASCRLSIEEIVYKDEIGKNIELDEIENRGLSDLFYYIRFAPSSYNNQPWRFVLKDDRVVLILKCNDEKFSLVDAGIIMYYFENMAKAIGISGKWDFLSMDNREMDGNVYKIIGEFKL